MFDFSVKSAECILGNFLNNNSKGELSAVNSISSKEKNMYAGICSMPSSILGITFPYVHSKDWRFNKAISLTHLTVIDIFGMLQFELRAIVRAYLQVIINL